MAEGGNRAGGAAGDRMRAVDLVVIGIVSVLLGVALSVPSIAGSFSGADTEGDPALDISDVSGGVAATVNGTEIGENAVTAYIESFRASQGLGDVQAWGEWLVDAGYSIDTLRNETVDYYVNRELIRQAAEERGLSASPDEVDAAVREQKDEAGSDEQWRTSLEASGSSEARARSEAEVGLLQQKLADLLAGESPLDDGELLESVKSYAAALDGSKRSSHILFEAGDEERARDVLARIEAGELGFAEAAAEYSKDPASAGKGGDVGWDKATQFVDGYQSALDGLSVGETAGPVETEFGIHLILCTDALEVPEGGVTSLGQVPEAFVDYVREALESTRARTAFSEYMIEYKGRAEIENSPQPDGLPYAIDLTPFEEAAREEAQASASGGEGSPGSRERGESDAGSDSGGVLE